MPLVTTYTATSNFTLNNVASPPTTGSALADAAAALVPGSGATSYAAFAIPTWGSSGTGWTGAWLDWQSRWHWDSVRLKGWLMGKPHGDTAYRLLSYDAATNTFTMPWHAAVFQSGHGYDCSALDPVSGRLYYLPYLAEYPSYWTGSAWTQGTGTYISSETNGPRGLSWHPHLYGTGDGGLVNGVSPQIKTWRYSSGTSGSWSSAGATPITGMRYSSGVYCSALNSQIVTCGDGSLAVMRITAGATPTATRMTSDLPVLCSSNFDSSGLEQRCNRLFPTPSGSVCILESASPGRVWRLNTSTFAWELQSYTHPLRLTDSSWPTMYVSTYGVYWALRAVNDNNSTPNSLLWRPPSGL